MDFTAQTQHIDNSLKAPLQESEDPGDFEKKPCQLCGRISPFASLVNSDLYSDVSIRVAENDLYQCDSNSRNTTIRTKTIRAHKILLHAQCPQLLDLCEPGQEDGQDYIDLSDFDEGTVLCLLKFVYHGGGIWWTQENQAQLFHLAHRLSLPKLLKAIQSCRAGKSELHTETDSKHQQHLWEDKMMTEAIGNVGKTKQEPDDLSSCSAKTFGLVAHVKRDVMVDQQDSIRVELTESDEKMSTLNKNRSECAVSNQSEESERENVGFGEDQEQMVMETGDKIETKPDIGVLLAIPYVGKEGKREEFQVSGDGDDSAPLTSKIENPFLDLKEACLKEPMKREELNSIESARPQVMPIADAVSLKDLPSTKKGRKRKGTKKAFVEAVRKVCNGNPSDDFDDDAYSDIIVKIEKTMKKQNLGDHVFYPSVLYEESVDPEELSITSVSLPLKKKRKMRKNEIGTQIFGQDRQGPSALNVRTKSKLLMKLFMQQSTVRSDSLTSHGIYNVKSCSSDQSEVEKHTANTVGSSLNVKNKESSTSKSNDHSFVAKTKNSLREETVCVKTVRGGDYSRDEEGVSSDIESSLFYKERSVNKNGSLKSLQTCSKSVLSATPVLPSEPSPVKPYIASSEQYPEETDMSPTQHLPGKSNSPDEFELTSSKRYMRAQKIPSKHSSTESYLSYHNTDMDSPIALSQTQNQNHTSPKRTKRGLAKLESPLFKLNRDNI
ncbi:hypothetical protein PoB_001461200 [Plakobranchus ocellatus]|uniref:BTB domain-containing protein n=1 Tax=Plakobranchus ocellatus TaxID=259542 RepID=A0AAV3Z0P9_9GAST|nr:hypothetical protein PoB_001461200 [Plakobranchus ocellatus]